MNVALQQPSASGAAAGRAAQDSQRAYARGAGLFYLLVLVFDIAGLAITSSIEGGGDFGQTARNLVASQGLYRVGLCLALIGSMSTIALAIGLYVTLKPVDSNLAMAALLFRASEAAIGAVGIVGSFAILQIYLQASHAAAFDADQLRALIVMNPLGATTDVAAIFFSMGSTIFFFVFLKTRYIPRILSGRPGAVARHRQIESFQDLDGVRVDSTGEKDFPLQLDGDYIGDFDSIEFGVEPAGLSVVS